MWNSPRSGQQPVRGTLCLQEAPIYGAGQTGLFCREHRSVSISTSMATGDEMREALRPSHWGFELFVHHFWLPSQILKPKSFVEPEGPPCGQMKRKA